jgi:hypothetical protein
MTHNKIILFLKVISCKIKHNIRLITISFLFIEKFQFNISLSSTFVILLFNNLNFKLIYKRLINIYKTKIIMIIINPTFQSFLPNTQRHRSISYHPSKYLNMGAILSRLLSMFNGPLEYGD